MTTGTPQNRDISYYKYRCKICGWDCTKEKIPGVSVPVVRTGDYGSKGTPAEKEYADELYEATTVGFVAAAGTTPAYMTDSVSLFGDKWFRSEQPIRVVTSSGTNDGDYTIAARGVSRGEILLSSSDSLTTETAATAGTVTISRIIWTQNITRGCPGCGSLWSR
ncbi:MAG TPA: hypothetical protein ACFYD4_13585 [Candidatus Wunengus sp. YC61]|uniref:hypothetical protein n=1 Tax=Candidatus Wunengus sp. YC61 TaxID=3367698 RepID=UPI004025E74C